MHSASLQDISPVDRREALHSKSEIRDASMRGVRNRSTTLRTSPLLIFDCADSRLWNKEEEAGTVMMMMCVGGGDGGVSRLLLILGGGDNVAN